MTTTPETQTPMTMTNAEIRKLLHLPSDAHVHVSPCGKWILVAVKDPKTPASR